MAANGEYAWFSGLDKSYSSRKRALVLRGYLARKSASKDTAGQGAGGVGKVSRRLSKARKSAADRDTSSKRRLHDRPDEADNNAGEPDRFNPQPLIRTRLDGHGGFDPFNSTASTRDQRSRYLVQQYLTTPRELFDVQPNNGALQAAIYSDCMHDSICVDLMRLMTASWFAARTMSPKEVVLTYRGTLISKLNARLSDPVLACNDATIIGIISLMTGDIAAHAAGVTKVLTTRGGCTTLPSWLDWTLHQVDIQTGGEISARLLKPSRLASATSKNLPWPLGGCVDEFIQVYTTAFTSTILRRARASTDAVTALMTPGQTSIISSYRFLAERDPTPEFARYDEEVRTCIPELTRMAVLLYTNMLLGDTSDKNINPHADAHISRLLKPSHRFARHPWHSLFVTCLSGQDPLCLDDRGRAEQVARCIYVYRRLTWPLRRRIEMAMMDLLAAHNEGITSPLWTPRQLSDTVLADLQRTSP